MFGKSKAGNEKKAMERIVSIVDDIRPLFEDRIRALSPSGFVLGELLKEVQEIARAVGGIEGDEVTTEVTNDESGMDANANGEPEGGHPEVGPRDGAARKGNAAARHAASIASGKTTIE